MYMNSKQWQPHVSLFLLISWLWVTSNLNVVHTLISSLVLILVHLGAMQHAVRYQMEKLKDNLHRGDVILANHPKAGLFYFIKALNTVGIPILDKSGFWMVPFRKARASDYQTIRETYYSTIKPKRVLFHSTTSPKVTWSDCHFLFSIQFMDQ